MPANRHEFSKRVKEQAIKRATNPVTFSVHCEKCTRKLPSTGEVPHFVRTEFDHRIEAALDGPGTLENCVVLCKFCHQIKTSERAPILAKGRRIKEKRLGIRTRKKTRPMAGTKRSKWKKKLDGTVERR